MYITLNNEHHLAVNLPFRYPCGVRDCLVCTKTVRVTTFPTTMANARVTMNTTARERLRNPQQHRVQRGASDPLEPSPAWAAVVRLNRDSVVGGRSAVLLQMLMLGGRAVMAQDWFIPYGVQVVGKPCPVLRNYPEKKINININKCLLMYVKPSKWQSKLVWTHSVHYHQGGLFKKQNHFDLFLSILN